MYELNLLQNSTAVQFQRLTFPAYHFVLKDIESEKSIVALGAFYLKQPVGLALTEIQEDNTAEVLSLFVDPAHREIGLGTALLTGLETELAQRGCTKAELTYMTGKPTTPAWERLLQKNNWAIPEPRMLVCNASVETVIEAPWLKRYSRLPPAYTIFPWKEITRSEREIIQQQQAEQGWIPEGLVPFQHEKNLEPLNSLGLRYQGQVVGWVINHRLSPDTIRYTCSFVREDLQKMGRIIALYAEAAKLQYEANIPYGIWTTPLFYKPMAEFLKHRFAPYLTSLTETRGTFKLLQNGSVNVLPKAQFIPTRIPGTALIS